MSIKISAAVRDESASFTLGVHIYARFTQYIFIILFLRCKFERRKTLAAVCALSRSQWVDVENRRWLPPSPADDISINGAAALIALLHTRVLRIIYPAWERDAEWKWRIGQRALLNKCANEHTGSMADGVYIPAFSYMQASYFPSLY